MSNKSDDHAARPHTGGLAAVEGDVEASIAMIVALAVRNGVEDLHAEGVFSDAQAPDFNRGVRNGLYEALVAHKEARAEPERGEHVP
jgi:hypothetical protein